MPDLPPEQAEPLDAALDVLGRVAALDPDVLRDVVESGISASRAAVRQPFYELGARRLGPEYRERAAQDSAAKIREWAKGGGHGAGGAGTDTHGGHGTDEVSKEEQMPLF